MSNFDWLSRCALLLCPGDFRRDFRARFTTEHGAGFHSAADIAWTGLQLRAELLWRDVSRAGRSLTRSPLFSAVAIAAIALSTACNVVIASIIGGVLFQPLPYPDPHQLVVVQATNFGHSLTYPEGAALAKRIAAVGDLTLSQFNSLTWTGPGRPLHVQAGSVTPNYFATLGIHAQFGRLLGSTSGLGDVVISDRFWREHLGAAPGALGQTMILNGRAYQIVGVAPPGLLDPTPFGLQRSSVWIPIDPGDLHNAGPGAYNFNGLVRVRTGSAIPTATAEIVRSLRLLTKKEHQPAGFFAPRATSLVESVVGPLRPLLWTLYAAVSIVLLIACLNVASLHVSRNIARESRLALLAAIGATRRRIAIELGTETALLAIAGAAVGVVLANAGLSALRVLAPALVPRWAAVGVNGGILLYTAALVPVITLIAGLMPTLVRRTDFAAGLRAATQIGQRRFANAVRTALVTSEIALATTLLIAAGVILRSYLALTSASLGFDADRLYAVSPPFLTGPRYASDDARLAFAQQAQAKLRAIPGVVAVAGAQQLPFFCCDTSGMKIGGRQVSQILINGVTPNYFSTLGLRIVAGRGFRTSDDRSSPSVAIVDETFARRFFGSIDAVGQRIDDAGFDHGATIVGVVAPVREDFGVPYEPMAYFPAPQLPYIGQFALRTDRPVPELASTIDAIFTQLDPTLAEANFESYDDVFAEHRSEAQARLILFEALAGIALILSLTGVYAVSAYTVEGRRREFGLRKALGATTGAVVRAVLAGATQTTALGIAIGIVLGAALSRFIADLLYATSPWDPPAFAGAIVVIVACALIAALGPALRAMRVDPVTALRSK